MADPGALLGHGRSRDCGIVHVHRISASAGYVATLARKLLADTFIARDMNPDPVTGTRGISLPTVFDAYIYRDHHRRLPAVVDDRALWPVVPISQIMRHLSPDDTAGPEADALTALAQLRRTGPSRLSETLDERTQYPIRTAYEGGRSEPAVLAGPTRGSTDIIYDRANYALPAAPATYCI